MKSPEQQSQKIREGAYGILIRNECVLMSHTRSGSRVIINFPGGGIDPGEEKVDALIREFREETGTAVRHVRHLFSSDGSHVNPDYPANTQRCHYYLVEISGEICFQGNSKDVQKLEWFSLDRLPTEEMLPVDREFSTLLKGLLPSGI